MAERHFSIMWWNIINSRMIPRSLNGQNSASKHVHFSKQHILWCLVLKNDSRTVSSIRHQCVKNTGRFSDIGVLYLTVEPSESFQVLSQAIQRKYQELEPFIPDPILHVTLAMVENIDEIEKEFYKEYGDRLPIHVIGKEVCLYEKLENTWYKRESFSLSVK